MKHWNKNYMKHLRQWGKMWGKVMWRWGSNTPSLEPGKLDEGPGGMGLQLRRVWNQEIEHSTILPPTVISAFLWILTLFSADWLSLLPNHRIVLSSFPSSLPLSLFLCPSVSSLYLFLSPIPRREGWPSLDKLPNIDLIKQKTGFYYKFPC